MSAVEVIVPWRAGCEHRLRALRWVLRRWEAEHPQFDLTVAELADGPWVKALAVMPAVARSTADVVVVADADVWCDPHSVDSAVTATLDGAAWAIPHLMVQRLTEEATAAVLSGASPDDFPTCENPYVGVASGGMVALRRDVALDVPLDARFCGWGGEDHSWGYALTTLHDSPPRGTAPLWHLWHPPAERVSRRIGSLRSERLRRLYHRARYSPDEMRRMIAEVPQPWRTSS